MEAGKQSMDGCAAACHVAYALRCGVVSHGQKVKWRTLVWLTIELVNVMLELRLHC